MCLALSTLAIGMAQANALLQGVVTDQITGEPLAGVNVFVRNLRVGTTTDSSGQYQLRLPVGQVAIQFSAVGYRTHYEAFYLLDDTLLQVRLIEKIQQIQEVVVRSEALEQRLQSIEMSRVRLDIAELKKLPAVFGEADLIRGLLLQPGVSTVGEGAGGFNVRGGRVDQNLVLLDGAPLFSTSHLLGLYTGINPDVVDNATLYKAGVPAQYGGRLSSLLLVNTRAGNGEKLRVSGGLSPLASRVVVEGPLWREKLTFLVGGRAAYPNWILQSFPGDVRNSRAFFYDLNGKLLFRPNAHHRLALSYYRSLDTFRFPGDTLYFGTNNAASLQWNYLLNDALLFNVQATHSDNTTGLRGLRQAYEFTQQATIQQQEITAHFLYTPAPTHQVEGGLSGTHYAVRPGTVRPTHETSNVIPLDLPQEQAYEAAAHLSEEWRLSSRVTARGGVRYVWFQQIGPGVLYHYQPDRPRSRETLTDTTLYAAGAPMQRYGGWEPRLSVSIVLTPDASVKASYNRTRQYLHLISNTTAISPVDFWKVSSRYLPPQTADQFAVGVFRNFSENAFETSVEVYYKAMHSLVEYTNGARLLLNPLLETDLMRARGQAYGVELSVAKHRGHLTGHLSYTYSRTWVAVQTPFALQRIHDGQYYPAHVDRPHNLALTTQYPLGQGWTWTTTFVFTSGRPTTFPDGQYLLNQTVVFNYSQRNLDRIPPYHRLDVALQKDTRRAPDQPRYSTWNLSVYNLYARKNPYSIYFTRYNYAQTRAYRLSVLGTLIPSVTWNFHF
ncbi:Outer membrane receptor proteins, mostly Fe transport [Catalinimonas alkaloidigena]|uniref:Outer membrane receptor proteins, mostly Fe transport n=2 Tax=Catalinimonas alkaloidigena TaxID=1075417 RepID=A0A1G9FBY9_9BACT|nr:Outer membrane receptor proteins, mostly Fe transport [Catalinimonas alkaloidigena]